MGAFSVAAAGPSPHGAARETVHGGASPQPVRLARPSAVRFAGVGLSLAAAAAPLAAAVAASLAEAPGVAVHLWRPQRRRRRRAGRGTLAERQAGAGAGAAASKLRKVVDGQEAILDAVEHLAVDPGPILDVSEVTPGPGLANRHLKVQCSRGTFLVKVNAGPTEVLAAERHGLLALREAACGLDLVIPEALALGELPEQRGSFLVMDFFRFLPFGPSIPAVCERFGHALATLHSRGAAAAASVADGAHGPRYGFGGRDTYLGGSLQDNTPGEDFAQFFIERRLRPQLERATLKFQYRYGTTNEANTAIARLYDRVLARATDVLQPLRHCAPSLLHGDLWSGNVGATAERQPILVDPACWYGHAEFDLALSHLFGRFGPPFYEAYFEVLPRAPGYEERQEVYLLYHMLNQANLHGAGFGRGGSAEHPGGYLEMAIATMERLAR